MTPDAGTSPEIPQRHDHETAHHVDHRDGGTPGAQGGDESPSADTLPGLPSDDDSPLGSTDQHSNA